MRPVKATSSLHLNMVLRSVATKLVKDLLGEANERKRDNILQAHCSVPEEWIDSCEPVEEGAEVFAGCLDSLV